MQCSPKLGPGVRVSKPDRRSSPHKLYRISVKFFDRDNSLCPKPLFPCMEISNTTSHIVEHRVTTSRCIAQEKLTGHDSHGVHVWSQ